MRLSKCFFSTFLLACFCFFTIASEAKAKVVEHKFDNFTLPDEAYLIEYDFKESLNLEMYPSYMRRDIEKLVNLANMYLITMNDGESYRNAVAFTMFLDNELLREGRKDLTQEQKERLRFHYGDWQRQNVAYAESMIQSELDKLLYWSTFRFNEKNIHKISYAADEFIYASTLVDYDWSGVKTLILNGEYGYASRGGITAIVAGIFFSLYFDMYTYNVRDDGVGILVLACIDSEKEYWQPIFANTVNQRTLSLP